MGHLPLAATDRQPFLVVSEVPVTYARGYWSGYLWYESVQGREGKCLSTPFRPSS